MLRTLVGSLVMLVLVSGCGKAPTKPEVTVYAALDREFSEPILRDFETQEQIHVAAKYDVESTKTVGLVTAIIQEQNRPRCDAFWNNEILHTLRLEKLGLLAPFAFDGSDEWPAEMRSPSGTWYGLAARARVLIVNTERLKDRAAPTSILDLADPAWKNECGLAKPLFGTTATHAAVLFAAWGDNKAQQFFRDVQQNAQVLSGNKQVALAVGSGQITWGLTDTDDAIIEQEQGRPVEIIYPDQGEGELGTLMIPNTLVLLKGSPHPEEALALARYTYEAKNGVEKRLADGPSAQFPVNPSVAALPRVAKQQVRPMAADFPAAAERWESAAAFLKEVFAAAE